MPTKTMNVPVVDVIKLFFEEIKISPKLRNGKKFALISEPAQKSLNNAIFMQNNTVYCF